MRRLSLIIPVAALAALFVSIATLTAGAKTTHGKSQASVSQGTATGVNPTKAERRAAKVDMAEEETLPEYSQVVDSTHASRFDAPGWKQAVRNVWAHGGRYVTAGTSNSDARFKLRTPTSGDYALYAWWPALKGNSGAARFGVETARGTKWVEVNQTRDGGMWVKLGTFEMKAGDRYVVRVSPGGGSSEVIADAVALVRGAASPPPKDLAPAEGSAGSGKNVYGASNNNIERRDIVRYGRTHIGTPYYHSPPSACWAYEKEDCSCFTRLVYEHFGKELPDDPTEQYWHKDRKWISMADLQRGDLVFFRENGPDNSITHVAMYSGNGYVLHASAYYAYQQVVESKLENIEGFAGARRIRQVDQPVDQPIDEPIDEPIGQP
jgi:cell wall-associated NlpC family hydrolase